MNAPATWRDWVELRRCDKLLWNRLHDPGGVPAAPRMLFDQHPEIQALCEELFPGGVVAPDDVESSDTFTRKAASEGKTVWRPRILEQGCVASASVLASVPGGRFDLVLATDALSLREAHLAEAALAWRLFEAAQLPLRRFRVLLLHRDYLRVGRVEAAHLFRTQDVTSTVAARAREMERLAERRDALSSRSSEPTRATGPWCHHPVPCPMHDRCLEARPEHSVFTLYRGRRAAEELLAKGIARIQDIPEGWPLSEIQERQVQAVKRNEPWCDREAVRRFLSGIRFPLHFIDFEACQTAVPFVPGTRPYQVVVVQFSAHLLKTEDGEPELRSHLADWSEENNDPRPTLLHAMRETLEGAGSIGVFNAGFEVSRLKEMAEAFPEHRDWIREAIPKMVDFWDPFRNFDLYHPRQQGRTGVKTLLPLVSDQSYEKLDIGDGHTASLAWLDVHLRRGVDADAKQRTRQYLERYCRMDTEALVALFRFLKRIAQEETRTPTVFLPPAPQAGVSTNSTTWATSG